MKKFLRAVAIASALSLIFSSTSFAAEKNNDVRVYNGKLSSDVASVNVDGRVYVPIRAIAEAIGGVLHWFADTKEANIRKTDKIISVQVNSQNIVIENIEKNGKTNIDSIKTDAPPRIINGGVYVSVRDIGKALGAYVNWDSKEKRVTLSLNNHFNSTGFIQYDTNVSASKYIDVQTDLGEKGEEFYLYQIAATDDGTLYIAGSGGLFKKSINGKLEKVNLKSKQAWGIKGYKNDIYYRTEEGIIKLSGENEELVAKFDFEPTYEVQDFCISPNGKIYIMVKVEIRDKGEKHLRDSYRIGKVNTSDKSIKYIENLCNKLDGLYSWDDTFAVDEKENIFIGTTLKGLYYYDVSKDELKLIADDNSSFASDDGPNPTIRYIDEVAYKNEKLYTISEIHSQLRVFTFNNGKISARTLIGGEENDKNGTSIYYMAVTDNGVFAYDHENDVIWLVK